jgi:hypothetical protein
MCEVYYKSKHIPTMMCFVNVNWLWFIHAPFWSQYALIVVFLYLCWLTSPWVQDIQFIFSPILKLPHVLFFKCMGLESTPKVLKYFVMCYIEKFTLIPCVKPLETCHYNLNWLSNTILPPLMKIETIPINKCTFGTNQFFSQHLQHNKISHFLL